MQVIPDPTGLGNIPLIGTLRGGVRKTCQRLKPASAVVNWPSHAPRLWSSSGLCGRTFAITFPDTQLSIQTNRVSSSDSRYGVM